MWMQLLTETALGALTGYITNHTAIQSLFKPGGVIEQTRDDFAREAGALLEEQVLTEAILQERLAQPQVRAKLQQILATFLQENLPAYLETKNLAKMQGAEEQVAALAETLTLAIARNRDTLCMALNHALDLSELLSEDQRKRLVTRFEALLEQVLTEEHTLALYLESWKAEIGSKTVKELELDGFLQAVFHQLGTDSTMLQSRLRHHCKAELESSLQNAVKALQLGELLEQLDAYMAEATLQDYLTIPPTEQKDQLKYFLQSEAGETFCRLFAMRFMAILEETDGPVAALLPPAIMEKMQPLFEKTLPFLVSSALEWARENNDAIGHMLESAVDEVAEEVGGMRGNLLLQVKKSMLHDLIYSDDTYAHIYELVMEEQNSKAASAFLLGKVAEWLQQTSVKDLVALLNAHGDLDEKMPKMVKTLLMAALMRYGEGWLQELMSVKPGSLHLAQKQAALEQAICDLAGTAVFAWNWKPLLEKLEQKMTGTPLEQLLPKQAETYQKMIADVVPAGLSGMLRKMAEEPQLQTIAKGENLLENWLQTDGTAWLEQLADAYSLQDMVAPFENIALEHLEALTDAVIQVGIKATAGQLSVLAENQIQNLSNEEMLVLVEDFMGRELQPLNYLGAAMGAGVGATVGTGITMLIPDVSMIPMAVAGGAMAGKLGLFGAVGYGTNCAAVKGLFWPYEPICGVHWAQGVIPKQKDIFSHSLGQLVNRYVINPDILQEILAAHGDEWTGLVTDAAANPDLFIKVTDTIAAERGNLSEKAISILSTCGPKLLADSIRKYNNQKIKIKIPMPKGADFPEAKIRELLNSKGNGLIHSESPFSNYVKPEQLWQPVNAWMLQQSLPDLKTLTNRILQESRSPEQILSAETRRKCIEKAVQLAETRLLQQEQLEAYGSAMLLRAKQFITRLVSTHGWKAVFTWAEENVVLLLQKNQEWITRIVTDMILARMGMMMRMGFAMVQGEELVAGIVDRVIQQKLPIFFSVHRKQLMLFIQKIWQEQLVPILESLLEGGELTAIAHGICNNYGVRQQIYGLLGDSLKLLENQPIRSWGVLLKTAGLTEILQNGLQECWQNNKTDAVAAITPAVHSCLEVVLHAESPARLTADYPQTIDFASLVFCNNWQKLPEEWIALGENALGETTLSDWVDVNALADAVNRQMTVLFRTEWVQQWLTFECSRLIFDITANGERWIPTAWRVELASELTPVILKVMGVQGAEFLQTMDLAGLAEEQLKLMDASRLEGVVRGFAQSYLTHIENRGWFGAFFAIPGILLYLL